MMSKAQAWLRAGLIFLALLDGVQGVWAYLAPRSFYHDVPTVSMYPPFSQHFISDFGGLQLAMTVVMVAAAVLMERRLVLTALIAFLVYALTHLIFHLTHLTGMTGAALVLNTAGLGVVAAIPAALLIIATRAEPHDLAAAPGTCGDAARSVNPGTARSATGQGQPQAQGARCTVSAQETQHQ
jgi:hypothetical protein